MCNRGECVYGRRSAVKLTASVVGYHSPIKAAFYGALVITAIQNGMDLQGLASGTKFVVTGIVLLLAVLVDSITKRRRQARGIA